MIKGRSNRFCGTCAVGIDGCPGGWIAAISWPGAPIEWQLGPQLPEILKRLPCKSVALIDMIIGLPNRENPTRECDRLARKLLSPHGSRVFPAPPREALAAADYPEACALARAATGKAISKQCWHLFPKIRELDVISDPRIRESHPELVFARLNGGKPIAAPKKSAGGQALRLKWIASILPEAVPTYRAALKRYRRKDLALCATATRPEALQAFPEDGKWPQIWY